MEYEDSENIDRVVQINKKVVFLFRAYFLNSGVDCWSQLQC
jgi:hypothetical protein